MISLSLQLSAGAKKGKHFIKMSIDYKNYTCTRCGIRMILCVYSNIWPMGLMHSCIKMIKTIESYYGINILSLNVCFIV